MASLYIAFNYIRRHLPKFLLICFCCSILISSAVLIPINSSISNFGGFLQANSSKSNYSRLFFNTGEDVDYSSLFERYCGLIGITGYTNLQNDEYCIGYADEIARDSLSVKLINGKLPENKNEIAVTDSMLEILNVNIGDTVTLDMTSESPGQREFVITCTVNDYYSLFTNGEHQLVAGDNSGFARAFPRILCGKQNDYLQKNIVSNAVCNYYAELDENYNIPFFSSDGFSVNDEQSVRFYNSYYSSNADTVFSYISAVAIIVGIFFGVYICVSLLINSEKGNNEILRNIGATGVLVKRVLLWQGLFISVIASVVSVGLVFVVTELINKIIYEEGYEINEGKFRLQYAHQRQEVTGLIVNKEVAIPQKRINELENAIYYCKKYGVVDHMSHIGCEKGFYKEHLYGLAYFIKMVNPEKGLKYLLQLNEIEWPI